MEHYAGIDVSLERSSVRVVDATGRIIREVKVPSEREALVDSFRRLDLPLTRIGLEAGPPSRWLHAGLAGAGFATVLLETRRVKAALSAMIVKTDRKEARGIAQLLRMGWYRPVHRKSPPAQETRALLVGREPLQGKPLDPELGIRGLLRGFGLKVGPVSKGGFVARIRELVGGQPADAGAGDRTDAPGPGSLARGVPRPASGHARRRPRRRGLPPADERAGGGPLGGGHLRPGGRRPGPVPPLTCRGRPLRADPEEAPVRGDGRDRRHQQGRRRDGAHGLVRGGERDAHQDGGKFSTLKRRGLEVAKRRGMRRARVALARKLACVLHRLWVDGSGFHFGREAAA
jgi:transposase